MCSHRLNLIRDNLLCFVDVGFDSIGECDRSLAPWARQRLESFEYEYLYLLLATCRSHFATLTHILTLLPTHPPAL